MRYGIIILLFVWLFAGSDKVFSQDESTFWKNGIRYDSWYVPDPDTKKRIESRWNEIGEDLKTEKNPLAGTYAELGYGSGYFLRWSTNKGFILVPYYDQSLIADFSYGKVEITPDSEVRLVPEKEMEGIGRSFRKTPPIWVPAAYGRYMVPRMEIASFGDYYGGFGEYNGFPRKILCDECGRFARRQEEPAGYKKAAFLVPPKYAKFMKKPITAEIVYIGRNRKERSELNPSWTFEGGELSSVTPVLINAGTRQGVRAGLLFLLVDSGNNYYQVLKITKVRAGISEGIVVRSMDEKGNEAYSGKTYDKASDRYLYEPFPPLKKGVKVTTSPMQN